MVGASRERVNKAIASFIRLGWIEQHDRRYRDPPARPPRAPRPLTRSAVEERRSTARQASAASSGRCAGRDGIVHEAVLGLRVAHDRDAGQGLERGDVVGRRVRIAARR